MLSKKEPPNQGGTNQKIVYTTEGEIEYVR